MPFKQLDVAWNIGGTIRLEHLATDADIKIISVDIGPERQLTGTIDRTGEGTG